MKLGLLMQNAITSIGDNDSISINSYSEDGFQLMKLSRTKLFVDDQKNTWFQTRDGRLIDFLFQICGDIAKKDLLLGTDQPITLSKLFEELKIPQTTGYRKSKELVETQCLIRVGSEAQQYANFQIKHVGLYCNLFSRIQLKLGRKKNIASLMINKKIIEKIKKSDSPLYGSCK